MNTRALAARASTQICHGACGSCPCRSRPLRLCVPADPVPAPIALECEVTYHELCAHAANTEGVIKEYQDGCPTCHMDVL